MELHPLAQRFAAVADEYDRGRPDYPPAVVGAMAGELGLRSGDAVVDLAAGTGKLTRALVAWGLEVTAVEPLDPLRAVLRNHVGAERVIEGVAEAIPLPSGTIAAVTVADAFHWFDAAPALEEIRRVLRPGGGLAIIGTSPDWGGASWAHELGTLVSRTRPQHPHFDGPPWQESVRAAGGWAEPRQVTVTTTQATDPDRITDHMASMSWIAAMGPPEREAFIAQVRALMRDGEAPSEMPIHFLIGLTRLD